MIFSRPTGEHSPLPAAFLICCTGTRHRDRVHTRARFREQLTLGDDVGLCFDVKRKLIEMCIPITVRIFVSGTTSHSSTIV